MATKPGLIDKAWPIHVQAREEGTRPSLYARLLHHALIGKPASRTELETFAGARL